MIDDGFLSADNAREIVRRSGVTIVDCEASALEPGSWPVEVGIARVTDGEVRSEGRLIRPHPDWSMEHWSSKSAEVHGIPLEQLHDEGCSAEEIAAWMAAELHGAGVSDAPEYERRWLTRRWELLDPLSPLTILDFDILLIATIPDPWRQLQAHRYLDKHLAPHRAAPDAARLAASWRAGGGHASPVLARTAAATPEGSAA